MADVARAVGVSPGALYGYVESKEALFDLAIRHAIGETFSEAALPWKAPEPAAMLRDVRARIERETRRSGPRVSGARAAARDVAAELRHNLGALYDGLARNAAAIRLLERCAADWPALAELYFVVGRAALIGQWRRYLARRIGEGALAPVPDVAIAARLVIETAAWFAWHRLGDPAPQPMDDALVRETVIAVLARGLGIGGAP